MTSGTNHTNHNSALPRPDAGLGLLATLRRKLRAFVRAQHLRRIEIVPSGGVVFLVVGEPESDLELYWLSPTGQYRLHDLVRTRGLSTGAARTLGERLRWCHASHAGAPRHLLSIAKRQVTVVSSVLYGGELRRVVSAVIA